MTGQLNAPLGGALVDLVVDPDRAAELKAASRDWPSWNLSDRQVDDLELLASGWLSPVDGYLAEADFRTVVETLRLPDGTPFSWPLALEVTEELGATLSPGDHLALRDPEGTMLAALTVDAVYRHELHDGVLLGGSVEATQPPTRYDFPHLRATPAQLRDRFATLGSPRVAALPSLHTIHQADAAATRDTLVALDAHLLLLPLVGSDAPTELGHYARVRVHEAVVPEFPAGTVDLALLALPAIEHRREAVLEAIVARNAGAGHLLTHTREDEEVNALIADVGVELVHLPARPIDDTPFPAVAEELRRSLPPRHERGLTVFFTGLSGSGKSTVANLVHTRLLEDGHRTATLLDGDLVRRNLSSELGFSKEHRDLNVLRIAYVASEISKHRGVAVACPIAPYDDVRKQAREMVEGHGAGFVLVHVATPLATCEARDRKGLYAKARAGIITGFTGIDDPYEEPDDAELVIDTTDLEPDEAAQLVLDHLRDANWLPPGR